MTTTTRRRRATNEPAHRTTATAKSPGGRLTIGIGDLHGNHAALEELLRALGERRAIFEDGDRTRLRPGVTLVFTGDYVDRGPHALRIIDRLRALAAASPHQVKTLFGNHELLQLSFLERALGILDSGGRNLLDRVEEAYECDGGVDFIREFHPRSPRRALESYLDRMRHDGDVGRWMRALLPCFEATTAVGRVLFMHADLPLDLRRRSSLERYLEGWARLMRTPSAEKGGTAMKYGHRLVDRGLFWSRIFEDDRPDAEAAEKICRSVGVDYVVTGHTYHDGIEVYGGRIFDIDVGMGYGQDPVPMAIVFSDQGIFEFNARGAERRLGPPAVRPASRETDRQLALPLRRSPR